MKVKFTSYIFALAMMVMAPFHANAETNPTDDPNFAKINGIVTEMLGMWDDNAYKNSLDLLDQAMKYDMTAVALDVRKSLLELKTGIEGTSNFQVAITPRITSGLFTVENGKWVKVDDAQYLRMAFPDKNGNECVLTANVSGQTKDLLVPVTDEDADDFLKQYGKMLSSLLGIPLEKVQGYVAGVKKVTVTIPETTNIVMTQNGKKVLDATIGVDLTSFTTELDGLLISASFSFAKSDGNGFFTLSLNQTGYKPGFGVNVDFTAKVNDLTIASLKLSMPGTFTGINLNTMDFGINTINMEVDVLGKAKAVGHLTDISAFLQALMKADTSSQEAYQPALDEANKYVDVKLYYDGSDTPAATMVLSSMYNEEEEEWGLMPHIIFYNNNNAEYAFKKFFSKTNFAAANEKVQSVMGDLKTFLTTAQGRVKEVSGVKNVSTKTNTAGTGWYTLDGRRLTAPTKGLMIVRQADGTTKKVMVK